MSSVRASAQKKVRDLWVELLDLSEDQDIAEELREKIANAMRLIQRAESELDSQVTKNSPSF